jgi:hypothetical protein
MAVNAGAELLALSRILAAWQRKRDEGTKSPASLLVSVLDRFPPEQSNRLQGVLKQAEDEEVSLYVWGPPVTEKTPVLHPIAKVRASVEGNRLKLDLRLFLFFVEEGKTSASGWRFDTAEPTKDDKPALHPYPHAQAIVSFDGAGSARLDELTPGLDRIVTLNESRPAFPLRGATSVGLTAAMVAALHGAPEARAIVRDANHPQVKQFDSELTDVLGASPF